jgi:hypothetical protein
VMKLTTLEKYWALERAGRGTGPRTLAISLSPAICCCRRGLNFAPSNERARALRQRLHGLTLQKKILRSKLASEVGGLLPSSKVCG